MVSVAIDRLYVVARCSIHLPLFKLAACPGTAYQLAVHVSAAQIRPPHIAHLLSFRLDKVIACDEHLVRRDAIIREKGVNDSEDLIGLLYQPPCRIIRDVDLVTILLAWLTVGIVIISERHVIPAGSPRRGVCRS